MPHSSQSPEALSRSVPQFLMLHFLQCCGFVPSSPLQPPHFFLSLWRAIHSVQFIPQGAIISLSIKFSFPPPFDNNCKKRLRCKRNRLFCFIDRSYILCPRPLEPPGFPPVRARAAPCLFCGGVALLDIPPFGGCLRCGCRTGVS